MITLAVHERGEQESDIARDWWRLAPRTLLPLEDGRRCLLLYSGRPGGPAGPDVRDAVLRVLPRSDQEEETQLVGDVEFHMRAGDWFEHGHQADPRYNRVILHIVLYLDSSLPTRRQDGVIVPNCSLLDLPKPPLDIPGWPCEQRPLTAGATTATLLYAGLLRFNEKSQNFYRALLETRSRGASAGSAYDICLLPALAEGLGYGRDRAFFRAVGLRLVDLPARIPEPLGHISAPAPLDARRLRTLYLLCTRWKRDSAWQTLRWPVQAEMDSKAAVEALREVLHPLGRARSDILIVNVILPFAAAVATLEDDRRLANRARQIYLSYPALASNRVTRMMSAQLHLPMEPQQACLQQGLHSIYSHTCQAKRCLDCLCGGRRL